MCVYVYRVDTHAYSLVTFEMQIQCIAILLTLSK